MTALPTTAFDAPAAWRGPEQARRDDWVYRLGPGDVRELDSAVQIAAARLDEGADLESLTLDDFPLDGLARAIAGWMHELETGRGFMLVRGVPVERYSARENEIAYWGLGMHMGTPVSQNAAGDLLGHVRDTGADPRDPSIRLYKTRENLDFHCDGSDIVGLLCLRGARRGGASRISSSLAVYNEVLRRRPDLAPLLHEPFHWDRNEEQAEGEPPYFSLPVCFFDGEQLRTFYVGWYIRDAQRHAEVPRLTSAQTELLDLFDAIASDPSFYLEMELEPGDIQWLKNAVVLHARTEFEDHPEPEHKRHLLRLWLTAHGHWTAADSLLQGGIPARDGVASDADLAPAPPAENESAAQRS